MQRRRAPAARVCPMGWLEWLLLAALVLGPLVTVAQNSEPFVVGPRWMPGLSASMTELSAVLIRADLPSCPTFWRAAILAGGETADPTAHNPVFSRPRLFATDADRGSHEPPAERLGLWLSLSGALPIPCGKAAFVRWCSCRADFGWLCFWRWDCWRRPRLAGLSCKERRSGWQRRAGCSSLSCSAAPWAPW